MHSLHYWAVQAEDKQEAFGMVKDRLYNEDGSNFVEWSDWHVVGGGRWSDSQYEDSSADVISYEEEPDKFNEIINRVKAWRVEEMNRCLSEIKPDRFISDIVDYISNSGVPQEERFSMNNYFIQIATNLIQDQYISQSGFYDMEEYTAHMGYLQDRIDNPDTKMLQFLVPVDFHH